MNCKRCKTEIPDYSEYCPICGLKQKKTIIKPLIISLSSLLLVGVISFVSIYFISSNKKLEEPDVSDKDITTPDVGVDDEYKNFYTFDASKVEEVKSNNELEKKIKLEKIIFYPGKQKTRYRSAMLVLENQNDIPVEVYVYLNFYDSDGDRVDKTIGHSLVLPHTKFVIEMNVLDDSYNYQDIKLTYSVSRYKSYYTALPNVTYKYSKKDSKILITAINKNNESVNSSQFSVLYYNNDELVYATPSFCGEMVINGTCEASSHHYKLINGDEYSDFPVVSFNRYEVYLSSSYSYTNEY